jgi:hypothetical protein
MLRRYLREHYFAADAHWHVLHWHGLQPQSDRDFDFGDSTATTVAKPTPQIANNIMTDFINFITSPKTLEKTG